MANLRVRWALPTTRESGNPLPVEEIKHVRVELSADSTNFTLVGDFPPSVTETLIESLDTGLWTIRGLVADVKGRVSQPVIETIVVDESAPEGVTFTLTLV